MPRSWEVTSDSITYWLAMALACDPAFPVIVLLKDVDGVVMMNPPQARLSRRTPEIRGKLVRRIIVHGGRPRPCLPSFPFDEYMFKLVDEFQQPFFVVHWQHLDRVNNILEKDADLHSTKVMPLVL
ncbi:MAG: hypothetical protein Q6373_024265 [Candidatus Sigynarchaeota archaeon]